jgi:hypothetical protein
MLTACGDSAETGIEQLIEQQGGGDVDLDSTTTAASRSRPRTGRHDRRRGRQLRHHRRRRFGVTGNADAESGEFNIESEDGSFSAGSTSELPEDWPGDVPRPPTA